MTARILILDGHPDPSPTHFCQALADAYAEGAQAAGHEVHRLRVADCDFPLLRSKDDWDHQPCPPGLGAAQRELLWATHLVILYPLWLGDLPALLKGFLEQVLRPSMAGSGPGDMRAFGRLLAGRSARVVVTMGMPGLVYRWFFRAHSLKNLERNILGFVGVRPVRSSVIGMVEGKAEQRAAWLARMRALGAKAA